jgi:hypothetical protein
MLRPGNAGSNTAADHVTVLDDALFQLPVDPTETEVIMRADSAGCTHEFLKTCRQRDVRFVVGHELNIGIAKVLVSIPEDDWIQAVTSDGTTERDHAVVCEVTDKVDLSAWPDGTRMIARREPCHPGAQLTFTDEEGHRFQVCVTDLADTDISYLEASLIEANSSDETRPTNLPIDRGRRRRSASSSTSTRTSVVPVMLAPKSSTGRSTTQRLPRVQHPRLRGRTVVVHAAAGGNPSCLSQPTPQGLRPADHRRDEPSRSCRWWPRCVRWRCPPTWLPPSFARF